MNIGDLVRLKEYCANSGKLALVISMPDEINCAKIVFIDSWEIKAALKNNLELVDESCWEVINESR